jgi:hypothetical protein
MGCEHREANADFSALVGAKPKAMSEGPPKASNQCEANADFSALVGAKPKAMSEGPPKASNQCEANADFSVLVGPPWAPGNGNRE